MVLHNGSFPPLPTRNMRGFLFAIYCANLVQLLEVNLTVSWSPPVIGSLWAFLLSDLSIMNIQQFVNPSSRFPTSALVSPEVSAHKSLVSCDSLYVVLSPVLRMAACSASSTDPGILMAPRTVVDFSICSAFQLLGWSDSLQIPCM